MKQGRKMSRFVQLAFTVAALNLPTAAAAQDKYSKFVGDWMASYLIAKSCSEITTYSPDGAADIAKSQEGLRRQKVLKQMYYGKTDLLEQQGNAALVARNLDPSNEQSLCKFGRSVAGKNDTIGRFLRIK